MYFPEELINIISEYSEEFNLLEWIPLEKLDWSELSKNKNAIHLLEKYPEYVDWDKLSKNENAETPLGACRFAISHSSVRKIF